MRVEISDKLTYVVSWEYTRVEVEQPDRTIQLHPGDTTRCYIYQLLDGGEKRLVSSSSARLDSRDKFEKHKARKRTLTKALLVTIPASDNLWVPLFPKTIRQRFWTEYFIMRGRLD